MLTTVARTGIRSTPVPVARVAIALGLNLEAVALGDDVSGVLLVSEGADTIRYNKFHSRVRQRFTIAHEIGHFVLHQAEEQLFIDKNYTAVYRRDQESSAGDKLHEIQANRFAAAVQMPEELVAEAVYSLEFDLSDEVARMFEVSTQAMSIRLGQLNLFLT